MKKAMPGDVLVKESNAGFVGEELIIRIPTEDTLAKNFGNLPKGWNESSCLICDDESCVEYANVEVLSKSLTPVSWCCHVSQCQMKEKES